MLCLLLQQHVWVSWRGSGRAVRESRSMQGPLRPGLKTGTRSLPVHALLLSCGRCFVTPWTVACQAPLSVGFSRQECWSGWPCPPPGDIPDPGIKPTSLISPALAGGEFLWVFFPFLPLAPPGKSSVLTSYEVTPFQDWGNVMVLLEWQSHTEKGWGPCRPLIGTTNTFVRSAHMSASASASGAVTVSGRLSLQSSLCPGVPCCAEFSKRVLSVE